MAELSQSELYFFIKMMVYNDHSAPDILFYLVNVYGEDFISLRRVQDIVKEFRTGERLSHKRKEGSGRKSTSSTEENVQLIKDTVEEDNSLGCNQIGEIVSIPPEQMLIVHDNARPHVSRVVTDFLAEQNITLVPQPAYSPDFNLLDRFVFRNFEVFRLGENYSNYDEVMEAVNDYTATFTTGQFLKQLESLKLHVQKIIDIDGDYL